MMNERLTVRWLGQTAYQTSWQAMQHFTHHRDDHAPDELWLLEHPPVFTQGQNGKAEHVLNPQEIPIVQSDRGGQVTYHGPGQLMIYTLIDLKRKKLNVRELVSLLEQSVVDLLSEYNISAHAKREAPGVYVFDQTMDKKICSIGLRIRRGCSYHGIAFNVAMNLEPFNRINPCGFSQLQMTQLSELSDYPHEVLPTGLKLVTYLMKNLGYTTATYIMNTAPTL